MRKPRGGKGGKGDGVGLGHRVPGRAATGGHMFAGGGRRGRRARR